LATATGLCRIRYGRGRELTGRLQVYLQGNRGYE